jgi:hypothetical protein
MRINVINEKRFVLPFISDLLNHTLSGKYVEMNVNGERLNGVIVNVEKTEKETIDYLLIKLDERVLEIPVLNETKGIFDRTYIVLETQQHSTAIEILE